MKKTLYLLCNAHLDPVWQWEWEEGAAAALSTFRCAADFCEEYDGFVFNHNEALLYRWVEEYEPALFKRIQTLVQQGRWHIMGGWHLQPDCNLPSGEAFVRQILSGRTYFNEKFGVAPTTAINFDPFGHTRGLVQILAKSGFDSYLFCRPGQLKLPEGPFIWQGYDGSTVLAQRMPEYNSPLGKATDKIKQYLDTRRPDSSYDACLWGVGDHGGGASRQDLTAIAQLKKELEKKDVVLLHATPEAFFEQVKAEAAALEQQGKSLPVRQADLNPWAPGCYTSQIRLKQKYRQLENQLFETEKMAAAAQAAGMAWPRQELDEAAYDLLTAQFHDFLPGSSIQPAEEMALRTLDHGLEILSRVRGRAFFALAKGQPAAQEGQIPILIYNPHPWPVQGDFECEMMLWDQNWEENFSQPQVWQNGRQLPTQCEKENSNLPLDWRKRVVFHADLQPMQMNRFDCTYTKIPAKPALQQGQDPARYVFETPFMTVEIDRTTGTLARYEVQGKNYLLAGGCALDVIADNEDPWGMTVESFEEKIGEFTLMTSKEAQEFCGTKTELTPVHVIEDGAVRTVVEALLKWGHSRAVVRYTLSKASAEIGVEVRVQWAETHKMLKLRLPSALKEPRLMGQVAFGEEIFETDGKEKAAQRYAALQQDSFALTVLNDGTYGLSAKENTLWLSLLRSPGYTAHPIGDRTILPQDRFMPHVEQGERFYRFLLQAGSSKELLPGTARRADVFNEQPMAISFFPAGEDGQPQPALFTLSDEAVQMSAVKRAEDDNGWIVRLFNPTDAPRTAVLNGRLLKEETAVKLGVYEVVTLRIQEGAAVPCDLMENLL